ncbi:MAG: general stress protein [Myxococcales bacterium]|nr:MAG: general stress protein [Myxococcales bacterium]
MATTDNKRHLLDIMKDFDNAMLVTQRPEGTLRGRPMRVASLEEDGTVYFVASLDSPKIDELARKPDVAVTMQGKLTWASVSGRVTVERDRAKIDRLWKEEWKAYFPKGKDDPEICLIHVHPTEGEFWDNNGTEGVQYVLEVARALVSGDKAKPGEGVSGHVALKGS